MEGIILIEIRQRKKDKYYMGFVYVESKTKSQTYRTGVGKWLLGLRGGENREVGKSVQTFNYEI